MSDIKVGDWARRTENCALRHCDEPTHRKGFVGKVKKIRNASAFFEGFDHEDSISSIMSLEKFEPRRTVRNTPLSETPDEAWSNTILYRLAWALGYSPGFMRTFTLDPDKILSEAIEMIEEAVKGK